MRKSLDLNLFRQVIFDSEWRFNKNGIFYRVEVVFRNSQDKVFAGGLVLATQNTSQKSSLLVL
jgi:hypothetical protein